jgi:sugar phosphate permease
VEVRYRWLILAVGLAAQASVSAVRQGLPSLGPALRGEFGLSLTQLGLVFASVAVGLFVGLIPWGMLADRVGERLVLAVGLTGAAAALGVAALAPDYPGLLALLAVAGAFGASATGASGRAVMGWFGRPERGFALSIRQVGVPLGGGLAAISLPLLAGWDGIGLAFAALAAGCLACALAAVVWMREPPPPPPNRPPVEAPAPLRDARLWRLAAGSALLVIALSGLIGFTVVYLHDERGWSAPAAAVVLATMQLGGAVGRVWAGRRSDRSEERVAPMRTLAAGSAVLIVATVALEWAPTAALVPVLVGAGVLAMSWNGLSFTAAAEMSGRERAGTAIGVQNATLVAAGAPASVAFAAAVTAAGWPVAWSLLAVAQVAGILVLGPLVPEERARRAARRKRLAREAHDGRSWHPSAGPQSAETAAQH